MSKTKTEVIAKGGPGFQPEHPRFGGRRKRTAAQARAMADELGVDPLSYLLNLLTVSVVEEVEIDADGKEKVVKVPVGHELKIDICKTLANYFYPRLNATQVTGRDEGPVAVIGLDMTALMRDPAAVEAAQTLALIMAKPDPLPAPADELRALPAPAPRDPLDTLQKDNKGHWV